MLNLEVETWNLELLFEQSVNIVYVIEAVVNVEIELWNNPQLLTNF